MNISKTTEYFKWVTFTVHESYCNKTNFVKGYLAKKRMSEEEQSLDKRWRRIGPGWWRWEKKKKKK